ncbi:MAG: hypothetical protein ABI743_15360 [bacterium]
MAAQMIVAADRTDAGRSAMVTFLGFVICLVLLVALPNEYTRSASKRGKSGAAAGSHGGTSGIANMGYKLPTGGGKKNYEKATRSWDAQNKETHVVPPARIPLLPLKIVLALSGVACFGFSLWHFTRWIRAMSLVTA